MFSNTANNSGALPFSAEDVRRVLASEEGRQLLALLRSGGGDDLKRAMDAARTGDAEKAKQILAPMLRDPKAARLLESLRHG